jgi:mRNA interferase MazF
VVVSNDLNNTHAATVTVIPITSGSMDRIYPFEVFLARGTGNLPKDSKAKADQVRTIDRSRLVKSIGRLDEGKLEEIKRALMLHLDLA